MPKNVSVYWIFVMKLVPRMIRNIQNVRPKRFSIAYYLMSYLSTSYQIVLDIAVDKPGHGKDVVYDINDVQKR